MRVSRFRLSVAIILIAFSSSSPVPAAGGHFFQNMMNARGGCGAVPTINLRAIRSDIREQQLLGKEDVLLFGKPILDWTEDDVTTTVRIYGDCWQKYHAMTAGPKDSPALPSFAQGAIRQFEADLRSIIKTARDIDDQRKAQVAARAELEKAKAQRRREREESEVQRQQEQLRQQAQRDRETAEETRRQAEAEEPRINEITNEAERARLEREAAERRLAEVRSRIDDQEKARRLAQGQADLADASRRQLLQRQAELEEDARLSRKCTVNLQQFNDARLGMSIREVERLFGCKGVEASAMRSYHSIVTTFTWDGRMALSRVTATFRDSTLESKTQFGLD
ncbi:hypothetical protein [Bradyrhizobium yuanmingense]|uniref:hypothetical protein n=1 Tax=Bradyrhizobium yuanmingense TaxID=108015 RepID=UPI001CD32E3C|nr:hypothetical protein [Bradyrhizobium yuanmingense]MCA1530708.1 hypothetical protein [Bradyrhizobium yuanmingense]